MESLQYDPRTKKQIKDQLHEFLYSPVQKHFQQRLNNLIVRNTVLSGHGHKSFNYRGVFYTCDVGPAPRWITLNARLRPDMDAYLQEVKELNEREMPFVLGYINQVLNSSNSMADYLKLLPDSVHHPLQSLVASCPCHSNKLTPEVVQQLVEQNKNSIDMIKRRMVTNLLI